MRIEYLCLANTVDEAVVGLVARRTAEINALVNNV